MNKNNNNYASFFERLLATLTDHAIYFFVALFPITGISLYGDIPSFLDKALDFVIYLLIFSMVIFVLEIFMTARFGGTVGKLLMGLRVQRKDGTNLTCKESFIRYTIGQMVSGLFFGMGYFWVFKNDKRQGWHDLINDSVVTKKCSYGWIIGLLIAIAFVAVDTAIIVGSVGKTMASYL